MPMTVGPAIMDDIFDVAEHHAAREKAKLVQLTPAYEQAQLAKVLPEFGQAMEKALAGEAPHQARVQARKAKASNITLG